MPRYFHFSLGPVQEFVAQSRRTRDLWAGSFLLSWLSGVAMLAATSSGGKVVFPKARQEYLDWIAGIAQPGESPLARVGGIPNRFKAEVGPDFDGGGVAAAVRAAWLALAAHVRDRDRLDDLQVDGHRVFVPPPGKPAATRASREELDSWPAAIWERQLAAFWETTWVIVEDPADSAALDRRKNWRVHCAPEEPRVKCSLMPNWQELSGARTATRGDPRHVPFWAALRARLKGRDDLPTLDLVEDERLCAIAYVRRRFAHHFATFRAQVQVGTQVLPLQGWPIAPGVPSLPYLAATPWLTKALRDGPADALTALKLASDHALIPHGEAATRLSGVRAAWEERRAARDQALGESYADSVAALDGAAFFEAELDNPRRFPGTDRRALGALRGALKRLRDKLGQAPSPFYALLLMDGDGLGAQLSHAARQAPITAALDSFTEGVSERVASHSGFLVYAGGDDVLALLPLDQALACATALRAHYLESFAPHPQVAHPSISAAVVFAHMHIPLMNVFADAQRALAEDAKEACGRDALAVRVLKPGGVNLAWSMPWVKALGDTGAMLEVERLAELQRASASGLATGYFHALREVTKRLGMAVPPREAVDLLTTVAAASGLNRDGAGMSWQQLQPIVTGLYAQGVAWRRVVPATGAAAYVVHRDADRRGPVQHVLDVMPTDQGLSVSSAPGLLVRFLAQREI
ncbi:MAG: type III-B CRISPR-associated protein Cas10/Cmr2 [Burkholderiales bacterium]